MLPAIPRLPKGLRFDRRNIKSKSTWLPTPYAKQVGDWLKSRREQIGLSLRAAAEAGDCSDAWLTQLENATICIWRTRVEYLYRICQAYKIDVVTLLKLLRVLKD